MSSKTPAQLSEKECLTLAQAWQCMDGEPKVRPTLPPHTFAVHVCSPSPQIDFDKLAQLSGYTVGSAKYAMFAIRKKLKALEGADGQGASSPQKTAQKTPQRGKGGAAAASPASGAKRSGTGKAGKGVAANADAGGESDDDEEASATPSKKQRRGKSVSAAVAGERSSAGVESVIKGEVISDHE